jgi:hypothetical protein
MQLPHFIVGHHYFLLGGPLCLYLLLSRQPINLLVGGPGLRLKYTSALRKPSLIVCGNIGCMNELPTKLSSIFP